MIHRVLQRCNLLEYAARALRMFQVWPAQMQAVRVERIGYRLVISCEGEFELIVYALLCWSFRHGRILDFGIVVDLEAVNVLIVHAAVQHD